MPHTEHSALQHRALLVDIARRAMSQRGLLPDFSAAALAERDRIASPVGANGESVGDASGIRDLTDLPWASIDNDDSRDLDQLTVAEVLPGGTARIRVAVADVDALVKNGGAIDEHARHNTTSVYTAARIFPMLPEELSTDLTSLSFNEVRLAGKRTGAVPQGIAAVKGLAENLRVQDRTAQSLKSLRHVHGALGLESVEPKPIFDGDQIRDLEVEQKNRAGEIIEDFRRVVSPKE